MLIQENNEFNRDDGNASPIVFGSAIYFPEICPFNPASRLFIWVWKPENG